MSEVDKATLRRIPLEVINEGRLGVIDEILAEDHVERGETPGFPPGRDGLKQYIAAMRTAFPDIRYSVLHEISEGDLVVQHVHATGTMKGDFAGMKATGKSAAWDEVHITRMRNGKAVEHWPAIDQLSLFQQLGVLAAPGVAEAA